jgi:hypothetical protein
VGKTSAEETYKTKIVPLLEVCNTSAATLSLILLLQKYPEVFTPDPSSNHRTIPHFTVDDFHVQGSRMLSRSFSVPKETVGPDPMGDVTMQSAGDEPDEQDAEMNQDLDGEDDNGAAREETTQADGTLEQEEDAEDDEDESDDEDGSEVDAEEEVMVPVADILNAAYDLDNVSMLPWRPTHMLTTFPGSSVVRRRSVQDDYDQAHSKGRADRETANVTCRGRTLTFPSAVQYVWRTVKQLSAQTIRPCRCPASAFRSRETAVNRAQGLAIRKCRRRL